VTAELSAKSNALTAQIKVVWEFEEKQGSCLGKRQNYSIYSNLAYIFPKKTQQRCGVLRDCDASNQWGQVV